MDRMIHVALNTMRNLRLDQTANAQNLANTNVPGYRRDLSVARGNAFLQAMDQYESRVYTVTTDTSRFSDAPGELRSTGEPLDVAIRGEGYFFVDPLSGMGPALSRRGDLGRDAEGFLIDGAGSRLLSADLQPIAVPDFREIVVDAGGRIFVEPQDAPAGTRVEAGLIGTTLAEGIELTKSADAHLRPVRGDLPPPDQRAQIEQGYLETSNVDPVGELVSNLEIQRRFELSVKLVSTAQEIDEAGTRIMRLPG